MKEASHSVSIPQAVGAVATDGQGISFDDSDIVSIPQAVGAVATEVVMAAGMELQVRFNTASGRCCCNSGV